MASEGDDLAGNIYAPPVPTLTASPTPSISSSSASGSPTGTGAWIPARAAIDPLFLYDFFPEIFQEIQGVPKGRPKNIYLTPMMGWLVGWPGPLGKNRRFP